MYCSLYSRFCIDASTEVFEVNFLQLQAVTVCGVVSYYCSQIKYRKRSTLQSWSKVCNAIRNGHSQIRTATKEHFESSLIYHYQPHLI